MKFVKHPVCESYTRCKNQQ